MPPTPPPSEPSPSPSPAPSSPARAWAGGFDPRAGGTLLALAALARIAVAWRAPIIESDGAYYASLAGRLLAGDARWLSPAWPPLLPALTAALAAPWAALASGASPELLEGAARAVSVLAGCAMLLPLYRLARRVLDERGAAMATALAAAHPRLIAYSGAALTESVYTACLVAATSAASAGQPALAGAALGLASLARPEAAWLGLAAGVAGLVSRRVPARALLRALGAFALIVTPYFVAASLQVGRPTLGEKPGYNLWRAYRQEYARHHPPPVNLERRVNDSPELTAHLRTEPVRVLGLLAAEPRAVLGGALRRLARQLGASLPWVVTPPLLLLAIAGVVGRSRAAWRSATSWGWVALPIAILPILVAPASSDRRFLVPLVPFVLLFAAAGWRRIEGVRPGRVANALLAVTLVAGLVVVSMARPIDDAPEHRAAGVWLRAHPAGDEPRVVWSRKPWVAFYSGGLIASLPEGGAEPLRRAVAVEGGGVLVMDERWARPHRPELAAWLDTARVGAPPALHRVARPKELTLYDLRGWRAAPPRREARAP